MTERNEVAYVLELSNYVQWSARLVGDQDLSSPNKLDEDKVKNAYPRTDKLAAQTLKEWLGNLLSYENANDQWYIWDGQIHNPCSPHVVRNIIMEFHESMRIAADNIERKISLDIQREVEQGLGEDEAKKKANFYQKSLVKNRAYRDQIASSVGAENLLKMMRTVFAVDDGLYENDTNYLAVRKCVFDLRGIKSTGDPNSLTAVLPHQDLPITKYLDADYDPDLGVPEDSVWMHFLNTSVMDDDKPEERQEAIKYLQKIVGMAFYGGSKMRVIANLIGPPSSGKSIFLETFYKMGRAGAGYSDMPESRAITKVQGQNYDQDRLRGRRFLGISEPSSKEEIDDDFLKRYTGDVTVSTRKMYQNSTNFTPQGILFVASNARLRINLRDQAIVERIKSIKFPNQFVPDPHNYGPKAKQRDEKLTHTLETDRERSIILNWVIEGMMNYVRDGYSIADPEFVKEDQRVLMENASSGLRYVNEEIDLGTYIELKGVSAESVPTHSFIEANSLYLRYTQWCAEHGETRILGRSKFMDDVKGKFGFVQHGNDVRVRGLSMSQKSLSSSIDELNRRVEGNTYGVNTSSDIIPDPPSQVEITTASTVDYSGQQKEQNFSSSWGDHMKGSQS